MARLQYSVLVLLTSALAACGPNSSPNANSKANGSDASAEIHSDETGFYKEVQLPQSSGSTIQVPYTIAGSQEIFNRLRSEVGSLTDTFMAKSVENIDVIFTDNKNNPVKENPTRVRVLVKIKPLLPDSPTEMEFKSNLILDKNSLAAKNIPEMNFKKVAFPFSADVICHDRNCWVAEVRLKKHMKNEKDSAVSLKGEVLGQVGGLYRSSYPKVRFQKEAQTQELRSAALRGLEEKSKKTDAPLAKRTSVVIVNGPAYSRIEVPEVLDVQTELLDTQTISPQVREISLLGRRDFSSQLVGHDPVSGSSKIDITDSQTEETARLTFEDTDLVQPVKAPVNPSATRGHTTPPTGTEVTVGAPSSTVPSQSEQTNSELSIQTRAALFPVTLDPRALPETYQVTQSFASYDVPADRSTEKDRGSEYVQHLKNVWLGLEKDKTHCPSKSAGNKGNKYNEKISQLSPGSLWKFFEHAPPIAPYMREVVEKLDVTPEIGYILLLESAYAKNPSYPAMQSPGSALGPWQVLTSTAQYIRDRLGGPFHVVNQKSERHKDDRTYFMNATYMAALYLKYLFAKFPQDPAIAILAYRGGDGNANKALKATQNHASKYLQFETTLREIFQYRMQTQDTVNCVHLHYTAAFLAARAIGQNRDRYHYKTSKGQQIRLDQVPVTTSDKYKERLKNPNGTLPPGVEI